MIKKIDYFVINAEGVEEEKTYELPVKKATVKDIYDAIKKNGFEHLRGQWVEYRNNKPIGGCVLGQAGINLSTVAPADTDGAELYDDILGPVMILDNYDGELLNNVLEYSIESQLNRFQNKAEKWNARRPSDDGCGDVIIYWNDAVEPHPQETTVRFVLETYEDVTNMCYDVLSPYFEEKVTLIDL